jgi:ATP-dependent Clp protease protease subunit
MPNSRVMIHQTSGGYRGTYADARIYVDEMDRAMNTYIEILARTSGRDPEQVRRDCDRDFWMSAGEARDYGLIDAIVDPKKSRALPERLPG